MIVDSLGLRKEPQHWITKLIIKDFDEKLFHPDPERIFTEVRWKYWVICSNEPIRHHQWECGDYRKWCGTPPEAPHFGGCWEREIGSIKHALRVTLSAESEKEQILRMVLTEIERVLNSKLLGYTSLDISDPDPVTPNSPLMGWPDASLPQVVYPESEILSRRRWRHSQLLADHFWRHFLKYYLHGLQACQKSQTDAPDLWVGTQVMIVDPQLPWALWPVGWVSRVLPGSDDQVRTMTAQGGDRT